MNSAGVQLTQAAAEFVSSGKRLAVSPGLAQPLLDKLMADLHHAPDPLLLWTVDILFVHRQSPIPLAATWASGLGGDPR
jgi:hypothetical protein